MQNKKAFTVELGGQKLELAVVKPSQRVTGKAQRVYSKEFREAVEDGAWTRKRLKERLPANELWGPDKQKDYETLQTRITENERKLAMGGNAQLTLKRAKEVAIQLRVDRVLFEELDSNLRQLDQTTAESIATNAQLNFMACACTVYEETGKPFFESYERYLDLPDDDPVAVAAANAFAALYYGVDEGRVMKRPENAFLLKYKFSDEQGNLVDEKGRKVDVMGRLIDESGRLVNEDGQLVDGDGNRVDEDGNPLVEFAEFLAD